MSNTKKPENDALSVIKIPVTGEVPLATLDAVLKVASIVAEYDQADIDLITNTKDTLIEKLENELILAHLEIKQNAARQKELDEKLNLATGQLNDLAYTERIINTLRDPLIVMDKDLRVMRCTSGFYSKFNVAEIDTEGHYFF